MDAIRHTTSLLAMPPAKWRLWIGALALFVQLLLPVHHVLVQAGGADDHVVLCTAGGSVVVALTELGDDPVPPRKDMAGMACPLCAFAGAQALLPPDTACAVLATRTASRVDFDRSGAATVKVGGNAAYVSRAPPTSI
jgi:hypothetical protein